MIRSVNRTGKNGQMCLANSHKTLETDHFHNQFNSLPLNNLITYVRAKFRSILLRLYAGLSMFPMFPMMSRFSMDQYEIKSNVGGLAKSFERRAV